MDFLNDSRVALIKDLPIYSKVPPYHPSESLPEWSELPISEDDNPAYRCVRQLLYYLALDSKNYGTSAWNPLGEIIHPGDVVVLKPNFVFHRNLGEKYYGLTDTDSLVTHGSVIRAVLDYVAKALQGSGKIIIGDCPIQGANWNEIIALVSLDKIEAYFNKAFPSIELAIKDYRLGRAVIKNEIIVERIINDDDFIHYQEIDLKQHSLLIPLMRGKYEFGVTQYPKHRMRKAHSLATNKYLFPKEILYADVIINLPKMKSHMKAGVTCGLKNFVGLNGHKDYLPHFRFGSPKNGGDEYPDGNWLWDLMWLFHHWEWELDKGNLKRLLIFLSNLCALSLKIFSGFPKGASLVGGGSWHGNDTLWRTILDINRAFFYFDRKSQRVTNEVSTDVRYITILDGLIAGQKESPLSPTPIGVGVMMAAFNPLAMDAVATAMMGFDIKKIKQINEGLCLHSLPLANFCREMIKIHSNLDIRCIEDIYTQKEYISLEPSKGFKGYIEYS